MIGLRVDASLRREGFVAFLAGVLSGAPLALEVARAHWGSTTVVRPDRVVGWAGDSLALPLAALWLAAAVAIAVFGAALWRQRRSTVAGAAAVALVVAALASLVMVIATVDSHLYGSNPVRGYAALVVASGWPLAITLSAVTLWALGRRSIAVAALFAAVVSVWGAVALGEIAALGGGHQPSVDGALVAQAVAAAWLVGCGIVLGAGVYVPVTLPRAARTAAGVGSALIAGAVIASLVAGLLPRGRAIVPVVAAQLSGRTAVVTIDEAGIPRTFRVHRPPAPPAHPPLVIALHAVFGSGFAFEQWTDFDAVADARGWLVAYPDGVLDGWDAYGSNDYWGRHPGADDIGFLSDMVDRLAASDSIDPSRIYVFGFSRGGMMTYRVGCELRQKVAAIASISGNMATESGSADVPCNPGHPVSVLATHGTADGTIPMAGGHVDVNYSPFADVIAKWRRIDSCAAGSTQQVSGRNTTTEWACAGGSTVETWIVAGGGHGIPDDAMTTIADFFAAHPLAGS